MKVDDPRARRWQIRDTRRELYRGPWDAASLARLDADGRLPLTIADALPLPHACAFVREVLPVVVGDELPRPIGFGLYPPAGAEPTVQLSTDARCVLTGATVPTGSRGALAVIFHARGGPVLRLRFLGPPDGVSPLVDVYERSIGGWTPHERHLAHGTGWEVGGL